MAKCRRPNVGAPFRIMGTAAALLVARAGPVRAQVSDSVALARGDSMSICPSVSHVSQGRPFGHSFEVSPFQLRGLDATINVGLMVGFTQLLPPFAVGVAMSMTQGKPRYAQSHDVTITGDGGIKLNPTSEYSALAHFESVQFRLPLTELQRLNRAAHITLTVGSDVFTLGKGQVQALQTLISARPELSSEGEIPTGCVGPSPRELQERWAGGGGQTYFEFQVEKSARVIDNGVLVYPHSLVAGGIDGSVLVQFVVLENGTADIDTFKVLRSNNELFTEAVRKTLPQMRFAPAEIKGKKVKQLVQLPFEFKNQKVKTDSVLSVLPALPRSSSQQVYTGSQVDKPVRNQNGNPLAKTLPPGVAEAFGGSVMLEFVVNSDGTIDPATMRVLRATDPNVGAAVGKSFSRAHFLPAELKGKTVRQLVQLEVPVTMEPRR